MSSDLHCNWRVHSCSSESDVHTAANVLKEELYRIWQTKEPADDAWLVLEAQPPVAFNEIEIVNSGSALVEVFGLRADSPSEDLDDYQMLLSAQQVMTVKDLVNKANRSRAFTYHISNKLAHQAAEYRWRKIRISCRQPFGTEDHKACIGLSRLNFKLCKTREEMAAETAEAHRQENLMTGLAEFLPNASSVLGYGMVQQVTDPMKATISLKVEQDDQPKTKAVDLSRSSITPGKRRLPSWYSSSSNESKEGKKKTRDNKEASVDLKATISQGQAENMNKAKNVGGGRTGQREAAVQGTKKSQQKMGDSPIQTNASEGKATNIDPRTFSEPDVRASSHEDNKASHQDQRKDMLSQTGKTSETVIGRDSHRNYKSPDKSRYSKGGKDAQTNSADEERDQKGSQSIAKDVRASGHEDNKASHRDQRKDTLSQTGKTSETVIGRDRHRNYKSPDKSRYSKGGKDAQTNSADEERDQKGSQSITKAVQGIEKLSRSQISDSIERAAQGDTMVSESKCADRNVRPFSKILEGVVFAISGMVNPERADLRDKALQMGGQYRPDWSSDCTLLFCAFANTPKFRQVKSENGTIVSKDWAFECYQRRELVEIDPYLMHPGRPWRQIGIFAMNELDEEDFSKDINSFGLDKTRENVSPKECTAMESMKTLASMSKVQQWASEDVASTIIWLQQQENQPENEELQTTAIQGIVICLDDAIECLKRKQSMKTILETWAFVPKAVQELSAWEDRTDHVQKLTNEDIRHEAERVKWIYMEEFKKIREREQSKGKQINEENNDGVDDDDMTESMSDDRMNNTLDWESDGTEILDEQSITQAQEAIDNMFAGY